MEADSLINVPESPISVPKSPISVPESPVSAMESQLQETSTAENLTVEVILIPFFLLTLCVIINQVLK